VNLFEDRRRSARKLKNGRDAKSKEDRRKEKDDGKRDERQRRK
jgi:hypothetical protein